MKPSDVVLLAVLGVADNGPASLEDVTEVARLLAPSTDWQPTTETIGTCVERAIVRELLRPVESGYTDDRMVVETTSAGRTVIVELLRRPIGRSSGGYMRACMSVKLCFLHYLPLTERRAQSDQLAQLYRDAIEPLRRLQHLLRPPPVSHGMICAMRSSAWNPNSPGSTVCGGGLHNGGRLNDLLKKRNRRYDRM